MTGYDLERFKQAQESVYSGYTTALEEIKRGRKTSHWIWYIFPQLKGLGRSSTSEYYGINGLDEAKAYLQDEALGGRLREITLTLLEHKELSAHQILGGVDAMKVKSCMTLFESIAPNDVFGEVLDVFYGGMRDEGTLSMLEC